MRHLLVVLVFCLPFSGWSQFKSTTGSTSAFPKTTLAKWDSIPTDLPYQQYSTVIKTNPFAILLGPFPFTAEYKLGMEFAVAKFQSTQITFSYLGKSPFIALAEAARPPASGNPLDLRLLIRGSRFQGSHRFYLNQLTDLVGITNGKTFAPEGIFFGPHVSYSTVIVSNRYLNNYDIYLRGTHFNVAMLGGAQVMFSEFTFEVFGGLGYKWNSWIFRTAPSNIQTVDPDIGGPYEWRAKFYLGYSFGYAF